MHNNAPNPAEQGVSPNYSGQSDNDVTPAGTPDHKLTAPKTHGFQNEYDRKRGGKPAWADDIACFKKDAARGLKRIGMNKAPGKALVAIVSLFAHSVFANEGDFYLPAKKLSNHARIGRTTANEVLAALKAVDAHEVTGCHGGGRINGRGIAAERWFYLPAVLDWLEAEFGKLPKGLKSAFNSLHEKLIQRRLSDARNAQQKQQFRTKSKCSEADTTKCKEIVDVKTTSEDAPPQGEAQAQPEMEINSEDTTLTSDETTQTQPANSPSQNDDDLDLEGANAALAAGGTQEVETKPETYSLLVGPNADAHAQDTAEAIELTASNDNHTPAAGNLPPMMPRSRAKVYWKRQTSYSNGLATLSVRTMTIDGEPWFVAKEVCEALEIARTDSAIRNLDADEKGAHTVSTPSGQQKMTIISERDLFSIALTSRKPVKQKQSQAGQPQPGSALYAHGASPCVLDLKSTPIRLNNP